MKFLCWLRGHVAAPLYVTITNCTFDSGGASIIIPPFDKGQKCLRCGREL